MHIQMNSYHNKEKLILSNVSKSYNNTLVLEDINIKVNEGELVTILGPSGSGKSTIFNIITNLTQKDNGNVYIDGKISYMQQKDLLLPYKTIIDNVSLPLVLKGEKKKKSRDMVNSYFSTFGLKGYENKYPHELSGGMRQRANFMRTFINSSDIMLLDEPFGALDSITRASMQNWLLDIKKQIKSTILLITHDIDEAIILSDRIYILSNKPSFISKELFVDKSIYNKDNLENIATLKKEILNYL